MLGSLRKLRSEHQTAAVQYHFVIGDQTVHLNPLLGKDINFKFTGNIFCIQCQRKTAKSFQQGHCFVCWKKLQECNLCVIHPERCRVEEGTCSKDDWPHQQCHQEHVVYLANSSGLKVGITRASQIPTRWIDQGAKQGLEICRVKNRFQAGKVEVAFKAHVADRTQWQKLLKEEASDIDLYAERDRLTKAVTVDWYETIPSDKATITEINYPILEYPQKIKNLSLDKTPAISGKLLGIKGQYLILDCGVINIRKFGGYEIELV